MLDPQNEKDKVLSDIEPLVFDLRDAFDDSLATADEVSRVHYGGTRDGYLRSTLVRAGLRHSLRDKGYKLLPVPNIGIDVEFGACYRVKVVRSDHSGNVPAPASLTRAAWCANGQMRLTADGVDPETLWDVRRLGLRGSESVEVVSSVFSSQDDGKTHLIVDWEEIGDSGTVRLAASLPVGVWGKGEPPRVAWRSVLRMDATGCTAFVPTDEDLVVFLDEQEDDRGFGVAVG